MEALVSSFKFAPSEIKSMSIRERNNWMLRAVDRLNLQRQVLEDG